MKIFKKSIIGTLMCLMAISSIVVSASAVSNNNYGYSFSVKGNQMYSYSNDIRYRGATTTQTPWKVDFTYSAEGKKTVMQYFLASTGWFPSKWSDYKRVSQGSGEKYFHAYDDACKTNVQLAARNNNNTSYTYIISGYWDEEASRHKFND